MNEWMNDKMDGTNRWRHKIYTNEIFLSCSYSYKQLSQVYLHSIEENIYKPSNTFKAVIHHTSKITYIYNANTKKKNRCIVYIFFFFSFVISTHTAQFYNKLKHFLPRSYPRGVNPPEDIDIHIDQTTRRLLT